MDIALFPLYSELYSLVLDRYKYQHSNGWSASTLADLPVSQLISRARTAAGLTRQQLGEATGYSAVMIAKIESGDRVPDAKRIPDLARALSVNPDELERAVRSGRRNSNGPTIVDAMKLAKQNTERVGRLKARAEHLTSDAVRIARQLDENVGEFDRAVISEFAELLERVADVPASSIVPVAVEPYKPNPEFSAALSAAQVRTSKMIYTLMDARLLGGAGATARVGGVTATYLTMANLATVATGTAIAALSGAATASATLAASGRLAATGMGLAAGTASVTGGVVAAAVGAVVVAALEISSGRVLSKQSSVQKQIDDAEAAFELNAAVVRQFITRASSINEILTIAAFAVRNHKRRIEESLSSDGSSAWHDIAPLARASIQRTGEIILACLAVLALPIALDPEVAKTEGLATAELGGADSVQSQRGTLEAWPEPEGEYIDYVIREAMAQVAR